VIIARFIFYGNPKIRKFHGRRIQFFLLRQKNFSTEQRGKPVNLAMPASCHVAPQRNSDLSALT
jgi:hypothetical protein